MRRLTLALAAVAALVPATLGLIGNSSFAQSVPTRVPASAQVVSGTDDTPASTPSGTPTPSASRTSEAGDDHGGDRPRASRTSEGSVRSSLPSRASHEKRRSRTILWSPADSCAREESL